MHKYPKCRGNKSCIRVFEKHTSQNVETKIITTLLAPTLNLKQLRVQLQALSSYKWITFHGSLREEMRQSIQEWTK